MDGSVIKTKRNKNNLSENEIRMIDNNWLCLANKILPSEEDFSWF